MTEPTTQTVTERYAAERQRMSLPEINHFTWPGGPIRLAGDDPGCFLFRHARGYKRSQNLRPALKGRRPTKYQAA